MDTSKPVSEAKNTIHLDVHFFESSGSMLKFAQSPEGLKVGKQGTTLLIFNDRIYYFLDDKGPHSIPEIVSKLLVQMFGLSSLKNNPTINKVVEYHDPAAELYVRATYEK